MSAIVALAAWLVIRPDIAGVHHDEGIYLSVAKSLSEGDGYRLTSVPGTPWQTKYPFLLSSLLAVLWKIWPDFPANLPLLKLPQVVSLGACAWFASRWYAVRFGPRDPMQLVCGLLIAILPGVAQWVDLALTELPFLALCLAAFYVAESEGAGAREGGFGPRRALLLGVLVGSACLLRQAGVPLILAGVVVTATARTRLRTTAAFVLPVTLLLGSWLWFRLSVDSPASPILSYYTTYEPSAIEIALVAGSDPALTIIAGNAVLLWQALDAALLLPAVPPLRTMVYPLLAIGAWRWWNSARTSARFSTVFLLFYTALLLCWPWDPARYALPLLAAAVVLLTSGTSAVTRWVGDRAGQVGLAPSARFVCWIPLGFVVALATVWSVFYFRSDSVWGLGTRTPWSGFEETFEWVKTNTPTDALLATPYDPMFHLYTGRQGVRPWFHRPWTYFYPREDASPDIGEPSHIRAALDELGVDYFIVSPLEAYVEVDAYQRLTARLLEQYRSEAYMGPPRLMFESRDGQHQVYALPEPR